MSLADTVRDALVPWQDTAPEFITQDTPASASVNLIGEDAAAASGGVAATASVTASSAILDLIGPGRHT